jgi:hypothetical protein
MNFFAKFFKSSPKKPEKLRVQTIRFIGEQDGPVEKILKAKLIDLFRADEIITKAYLVKVNYSDGANDNVVLGLRAELGPDEEIVKQASKIFASIFNPKDHLDIIFLAKSQETELAKVCNSFYEKVMNS